MFLHWLQSDDGDNSYKNLQLDIVGFLAILGEGSVLANAQVSTLSKWIFLPRLIPAPQALMRPTRPTELEPVPGFVSGIYSGNHRDSINHIGNIVWYVSSPLVPEIVERTGHHKPFPTRSYTQTRETRQASATTACAYNEIVMRANCLPSRSALSKSNVLVIKSLNRRRSLRSPSSSFSGSRSPPYCLGSRYGRRMECLSLPPAFFRSSRV